MIEESLRELFRIEVHAVIQFGDYLLYRKSSTEGWIVDHLFRREHFEATRFEDAVTEFVSRSGFGKHYQPIKEVRDKSQPSIKTGVKE